MSTRDVPKVVVDSFSKTVEFLQDTDAPEEVLEMNYKSSLNPVETEAGERLPEMFDLDQKLRSIIFTNLRVDTPLFAEIIRRAVRKEKIKFIEFGSCKVRNNKILDTMCQGLRERSSDFELSFDEVPRKFVTEVMAVSFSKCVSLSLEVAKITPSGLEPSLKNIFLKGKLCSLVLRLGYRMKDSIFLELVRCISMMSGLNNLDLAGTGVPYKALRRFPGSLKVILPAERSNLFESLCLGPTEMDERLVYYYFTLLRCDLIRDIFVANERYALTPRIVKSLSSIAANTTNLSFISLKDCVCSYTGFDRFSFQYSNSYFSSPFGVNPARRPKKV